MTRRIWLLFLVAGISAGCSSPRKISQVEVRHPSSVSQINSISGTRAKLGALMVSPKCGPSIQENFPSLVLEKVSYPQCSEFLVQYYGKISSFLEGEEKSLLEEVISSKCRSSSSDSSVLTLESLSQNFNTTGPLGRMRIRISDTNAPDIKNLEAFYRGLQEMLVDHAPIDRWIKKNGEYLIPEDDLGFFEVFLQKNACLRKFLPVEEGYRAVQNLEGIVKQIENEKTRLRTEKLLHALYQAIDQRAKELFFIHD